MKSGGKNISNGLKMAANFSANQVIKFRLFEVYSKRTRISAVYYILLMWLRCYLFTFRKTISLVSWQIHFSHGIWITIRIGFYGKVYLRRKSLGFF